MAIDYTAMAAKATAMLTDNGVKWTLTSQPEGTTSSVYGIIKSGPSVYENGTTTEADKAKILLSAKLKIVPKPGDWIARGSSTDQYYIVGVNSMAPAGITVYYELIVGI